MGNWSEQQILKKEIKEKDKTRKENLAKYFLDLSKLTFVALVLGSMTSMYVEWETSKTNWYLLVFGVAFTIILGIIGNRILK